jgi:predicted DNA-binding transcriptional regulator YafY
MRADRLVAVLLVLQSGGRVTAAEIADELEISERTARRDLDALAMAGIPVYSQQGRGGGWELIGGARTDLSGLTAAEARALFLVAGPSSSATPEVKAALRKLVHAIPEPFRVDAEAAAAAVIVDPAGWGRTVAPEPPRLDELRDAVVAGEQIRLSYTDRLDKKTTRVVHPLGLVTKGSTWYLVSNSAAGLRTFRVDRVNGVERLGKPVERPDGFDLAAEWERISAEVDERRAPLRATARVEPRVLPMVRFVLGEQLRVVREAKGSSGRAEIEISGPTHFIIAAQIAGFGRAIEIIEPREVQQELTRIGRELATAYPD